MVAIQDDCVVVILPELYDPAQGYELGVIWQGLTGVFCSGFFCGHDYDLAIEYAAELNRARGHDKEFVNALFEKISGISNIHFFNV